MSEQQQSQPQQELPPEVELALRTVRQILGCGIILLPRTDSAVVCHADGRLNFVLPLQENAVMVSPNHGLGNVSLIREIFNEDNLDLMETLEIRTTEKALQLSDKIAKGSH